MDLSGFLRNFRNWPSWSWGSSTGTKPYKTKGRFKPVGVCRLRIQSLKNTQLIQLIKGYGRQAVQRWTLVKGVPKNSRHADISQAILSLLVLPGKAQRKRAKRPRQSSVYQGNIQAWGQYLQPKVIFSILTLKYIKIIKTGPVAIPGSWLNICHWLNLCGNFRWSIRSDSYRGFRTTRAAQSGSAQPSPASVGWKSQPRNVNSDQHVYC